MNLPRYDVETVGSSKTFSFISKGIKGEIPKLVKYTETNIKGVYNLAFGDTDGFSGTIDDSVISNNGDSEKVLATVVTTVYAFTAAYPESWIYARGSSKSRTRLYRMGITRFYDEIVSDFDIYGLFDDEWQDFNKGTEYDAFLVYRKTN